MLDPPLEKPPDPPPNAPRPGAVLVGRSRELATLRDLVGLGREVSGAAAVLLAGDAGVGKTRLLRECQDGAGSAGWHVLVGHCLDFGGDALPYLPFTEVFGRLAAESPTLVEGLLEAGPALSRLLPGRRRPNDGAGAGTGDRAGARPELFEAVRSALEQLARTAPVLLVVEDVHWADASTREMLSFLFTRALTGRVSIVASYRADDLHRKHPLRAQVAQWSRLRSVERLHLQPLPDPDVRTLVRELQPTGLDARDVERIVARAEGNAFFIEELVRAAQHGEQVLSADLSDLLLLHLDQLDDTARTVLRAVSVAGRRVSHSLLAQVMGSQGPDGLDPPALEHALRAAIDRNVLVAAQPEGYAFRHALLAEAVYDDLLPGERVRWHRAYVDMLRSGSVDAAAADLARHARAAHDLPTAIGASIQAGDEAMIVGGPAEAARHYEQALELLAERPVAGGPHSDEPGRPDAVDAVDIVDLVLRASESAVAAGSLHRALALLQDQLAALPADAAPAQRALLLNAVASTALLDDAPIDALALTTEALRLTPAAPAGPLRARVMAVHARANASRHREHDAIRWATEAVDLARELDLPSVLADATTTLVRVQRYPAPQEAEQALHRSVAEARSVGDAAAELRSTHNLGTVLYERGALIEAQDAFVLAAARATELRRPWAPYGLDGRSMAGIVSYTRGDWTATLGFIDTSGETPPPMARAMLDAVALTVSAGRGDVGALGMLPRLRPWWNRDGLIAVICAAAAIDLHGDSGDLGAAVATHDDVVALVGLLWEDADFEARIRLSALLLGQLATSAAQVGARERADLARQGRELHAAAERAAANATRSGPESQAWLARARAEALRLAWLTGDETITREGLVAVWVKALAAFERFGHVFEIARTRARLAAALRAVGDPAAATAEVALATDVAQRLGARPLLRELRTLGQPPPRSTGGDVALTARENEVLALVAQGRSNREIAQVLYISAKTVSVHVSNILTKLEVGGRTEAAAVARRRGLLPAD